MRIEIKHGNQKQRVYVEPHLILRYLISDDEKLDTMIVCKPKDLGLYTTDLALHEALCSIKPFDNFKLNKLVKFVETVDVLSYNKETGKEKPIVTHERVESLRAGALKQ